MFCEKCGSEMSESDKFCRICGTPAANQGTAPGYDTGVTRYNRVDWDPYPENGGGATPPAYEPGKTGGGKTKSYGILLGILGVIIVALLGGIAYIVIQLVNMNGNDGVQAATELTTGTQDTAEDDAVSGSDASENSDTAKVEKTSKSESASDESDTSDAKSDKKESEDAKVSYGGHHYQLIEEDMSWNAAKIYCENLSGHLVTITSQGEEDFIEDLVEDGKMYFYWIGAYDTDQNPNEYYWVTGESFAYNNWASGQPDNGDWGVGGFENYAGILREKKHGTTALKWNDYRDTPADEHGLICEWDS